MDRSATKPEPIGATLDTLSVEGRSLYDAMIEDFIGDFPEVLVKDLRLRLRSQVSEARFAWWGAVDSAAQHFFRLQAPSFVLQVRDQGLERGHVHLHTSFRRLDDGSVASSPPP